MPAGSLTDPDLHELTRPECLALLTTARSGRLLLQAGELRVSLPVELAAGPAEIELRAAAGGVLPDVRAGALVGVEVLAAAADNSWSVTVLGRAPAVRPGPSTLTLPVELVFGSRTGRGPLVPAVPAPRAAP
jgi:hypothetical protein